MNIEGFSKQSLNASIFEREKNKEMTMEESLGLGRKSFGQYQNLISVSVPDTKTWYISGLSE